jgi:hypothetical protein
MHEAPLSLKLLTNHVTKWQVQALLILVLWLGDLDRPTKL